MSPKDQILSSELHGEALLIAKRPELQLLIDHLRKVAQGRDDLRTECGATIAGSWFAGAARRGGELIAAGLLLLAGHVDLEELDRWVRVGWERRRGSTIPYGPTAASTGSGRPAALRSAAGRARAPGRRPARTPAACRPAPGRSAAPGPRSPHPRRTIPPQHPRWSEAKYLGWSR
jgi:hypothetical protein